MKLQLPQVTLICFDCENVYRAIRVLEHCKSLCDFGAVKFLTSEPCDYPHVEVEPIKGPNRVEGLVKYSDFCLRKLHTYVDTSHLMIVQHDGWILNTAAWRPEFLTYDYIGPLFLQEPKNGSGGFSLRTKRLMATVAEILPPYERYSYGSTGYCWEDGVIALGLRPKLEQMGLRFAPAQLAAQWAYGGNKTHYCGQPFGFHGFYALDTLLGGTGEPIPRTP